MNINCDVSDASRSRVNTHVHVIVFMLIGPAYKITLANNAGQQPKRHHNRHSASQRGAAFRRPRARSLQACRPLPTPAPLFLLLIPPTLPQMSQHHQKLLPLFFTLLFFTGSRYIYIYCCSTPIEASAISA